MNQIRLTFAVSIAVIVSASLLLTGCGSSTKTSHDDPSVSPTKSTASSSKQTSDDDSGFDDAKIARRADSYDKAPTAKIDPAQTWFADVATTKGTFTIELLPKEGPRAASNFAALAEDGFYDGVKFHRIIKGFMVQTGDPLGTGVGGPGYSIPDDKVNLPYKRGIVAMANAGPDTGGSQFFIVQGDEASSLPPNYAIFGRVTKGMQVIDAIADTPVTTNEQGEPSKPTETVRITGVTIRNG